MGAIRGIRKFWDIGAYKGWGSLHNLLVAKGLHLRCRYQVRIPLPAILNVSIPTVILGSWCGRLDGRLYTRLCRRLCGRIYGSRGSHGQYAVEADVDYYAILEMTNTPTIEVARKRYRRLAMIQHPDKNQDQNSSTAAFQRVFPSRRKFNQSMEAKISSS